MRYSDSIWNAYDLLKLSKKKEVDRCLPMFFSQYIFNIKIMK